MKKILSLLMCYVFLQAETFAMRGGPGANGKGQLLGVYSAILIQSSPDFDLQGNQITAGPGTGLGLVTLSVPGTGPAIGNLLIFDSQTGDTFLGKANGLTNPQTGQLMCLVSGSQYTLQSVVAGAGGGAGGGGGTPTGATTPSTTTESISGKMTASKAIIRSTSYSQIAGTANLVTAGIPIVSVVTTGNPPVATTVNSVITGTPATYDVVGYLTSTSSTTPSTFVLSGSN